MCRPHFYGIEYTINPWMEGNVGRARRERALLQWETLYRELQARASVELLEAQPGLPDMPFTANAGLILGDLYIPSHFRVPQRRPEVPHYKRWCREHGFRLAEQPSPAAFEGEGDALFQHGERLLWAGYGIRSSLEAYSELTEMLQVEVVPLRLIDTRFYHLDTCFCPLPGGRVLYYPGAFDRPSLEVIRSHFAPHERIELSETDALHFACNAVPVTNALLLNAATPELQQRLESWGFEVVICPLSEFLLAGGSAKCLTLRLAQEVPASPTPPLALSPAVCSREMEIEGHLLDTGLLGVLLDVVSESGGSLQITQFHAPSRRDYPSSMRFHLSAPSCRRLEEIASQLLQYGAHALEAERDALLRPVVRQGVAPEEFYVTTASPTEVRIAGNWLRVERQRAAAVVTLTPDGSSVFCTPLCELRPGQLVVCDVTGIRTHTPSRLAPNLGSSLTRSGYPQAPCAEAALDQIAWEMSRVRARRGRIVAVAGPPVCSTGARDSFLWLLQQDYVQALLAPNALGVLDIAQALFPASAELGMDATPLPYQDSTAPLRAVNAIREKGGICQAVEEQRLQSGILHTCVKQDIAYLLASSMRDEELLPETQTDTQTARRHAASLLEEADIVLVLSSRLLGLATHSLAPLQARLYCVDTAPAVALRIASRSAPRSLGVVLDVHLFLSLLVSRLQSGTYK